MMYMSTHVFNFFSYMIQNVLNITHLNDSYGLNIFCVHFYTSLYTSGFLLIDLFQFKMYLR